MAAGWPTNAAYVNGTVFNASDINDTNGTLNYIDPTAATDNQVLTRDNATPGKVKWANSPANTLTTTGDLYYASAANTPARLGIGTTGQALLVSGGVPAWGGVGGQTSIASGSFSGSTVTLSSISQSYKDLKVLVRGVFVSSSGVTTTMRLNGISTTVYNMTTLLSNSATPTTATGQTGIVLPDSGGTTAGTTATYVIDISNYTTTLGHPITMTSWYGTGSVGKFGIVGGSTALEGAITSISFTLAGATYSGGTYILYGIS